MEIDSCDALPLEKTLTLQFPLSQFLIKIKITIIFLEKCLYQLSQK